jgi:cathepsin E
VSLKVPIIDAFVSGQVHVAIGSPSTQYTLLFDPGSSNTWVGANKKYVVTSSSHKTSDTVAVSYGSGNFSGNEYTDLLALNGVAFSQSIGVATNTAGLQDVDGILGLGPTNLTTGTLSPDTKEEIPTVTDNLYSQGDIDSPTVTITNTTITFGPAPSVHVTYASITKSSPADTFWGFDASFAYGTKSLQSTTAGIIDHGTTLILLATSGYNSFLRQTKATQDSTTGLPMLSSCAKLDPMILTFAGVNITIPVGKYRWPAAQNTAIGGVPANCYLAVADIGTDFDTFHQRPGLRFRRSMLPDSSDKDINFILGYNTLKHFTVVLDKSKSRVGIASSV